LTRVIGTYGSTDYFHTDPITPKAIHRGADKYGMPQQAEGAWYFAGFGQKESASGPEANCHRPNIQAVKSVKIVKISAQDATSHQAQGVKTSPKVSISPHKNDPP
jgi:hypothetical protein